MVAIFAAAAVTAIQVPHVTLLLWLVKPTASVQNRSRCCFRPGSQWAVQILAREIFLNADHHRVLFQPCLQYLFNRCTRPWGRNTCQRFQITTWRCGIVADPGISFLEAAPNSVESEGRFRLSTILSHLSFGVHRNLVSEFGFQHPEVLVALDAPEVLLRLQEG